MPRVVFTGGGSLDGAVREVPPGHVTVVTADRRGQSWYADPAATGVYRYIGYGEQGALMSGIIRQFTAALRRDQEYAAEVTRARGCPSCGLTFASAAAYQVHRDEGWPGGCLPPGAMGQLQERDGVWVLPGSDVARR